MLLQSGAFLFSNFYQKFYVFPLGKKFSTCSSFSLLYGDFSLIFFCSHWNLSENEARKRDWMIWKIRIFDGGWSGGSHYYFDESNLHCSTFFTFSLVRISCVFFSYSLFDKKFPFWVLLIIFLKKFSLSKLWALFVEFLFYDGKVMKIEELGNLLSSSYHSLRVFCFWVCVFFTLFCFHITKLSN